MSHPTSSNRSSSLPPPPDAVNEHLLHGEGDGALSASRRAVPDGPGGAPKLVLREHSSADEQGSDSESGEASLEDLNNDLAYLRGRIKAVSKQRAKLLARRAPMNKLPIEVRLPYKLT